MNNPDTLLEFWDKNKDELIPLCKNSVAIWDAFVYSDNKNRHFPQAKLMHVTEQNEDIIIIDIFPENKSDIFWALSIATFRDDKSIEKNIHYHNPTFKFDYYCDNCSERIMGKCYHCSYCDFDVCTECISSINHDHTLFENSAYFGINTFEKKNIKCQISINLKN